MAARTARSRIGRRRHNGEGRRAWGGKLTAVRDCRDAGRRLAVALERFRDQRPIVVGIPRGGVPVAAEVAASLGAPLDVALGIARSSS